MMRRIHLAIPLRERKNLWRHLLPRRGHKLEEAAFLFAHAEQTSGDVTFRFVEWYPVGAEEFTFHSGYHIELSDAVRANVIKRAHDLKASLIEVHSHISPGFARFSGSDLSGFEEFVPHIWWRLKGRPYMALVVTQSGFDGLAWLEGPASPEYVSGIFVEGAFFKASNISLEESFGYESF